MLNENIGQGCVLDCAELMEVVAKKGSWYSYKDIRYAWSSEEFKSWMDNLGVKNIFRISTIFSCHFVLKGALRRQIIFLSLISNRTCLDCYLRPME